MLRITAEQKPGSASLTVEGKLAGPWVAALEQSWKDLRDLAPAEEHLSVNLCGVSYIDGAGKALLRKIHGEGGKLVAEGCLNQAIVREIAADESRKKNGAKKTTPIIFYVLLFGLVAASAGSVRAQSTGGRNGLPANAPT